MERLYSSFCSSASLLTIDGAGGVVLSHLTIHAVCLFSVSMHTAYLLLGVGSLLFLCETVVKIPQIMGGIFASMVPQSPPEGADLEMDDAGSEKTDITNVPASFSSYNSINGDQPK